MYVYIAAGSCVLVGLVVWQVGLPSPLHFTFQKD